MVLLAQLAAVLLAALALWSIRHEVAGTATSKIAWAIPPALAFGVMALLLLVSPGKRYELWIVAFLIGLGPGAVAGWLLKLNRDTGKQLMRVPTTWDGAAAAAALLVLTIARFVSTNLMDRQSGKFGVLGAAAIILTAYLVGRWLVARYYKFPNAIHLDMNPGRNPGRTLVG
jgi:hypothetical protein